MISNLEQRLQDELGLKLYDEYRQAVHERRTEDFCDLCIANQKRRGWWGNIECNRSADEAVADLAATVPDPEQRYIMSQAIDPVVWAKEEFGWEARWYQCQAMRCTAQWQCHRWGRRTGKTNFLAIKSLHLCATKPGTGMRDPFTVLVVTPYQDQLAKIFQYARDALAKARTLTPTRDINDPHCLEFANGSKMIGFTAGEKTGARSEKIRGQDANAIVIDEADRIRSDDIDAVMAILASHKDCLLYFSTTPTGLPTRFKTACENPDLGYKEFHFASYESPDYTDRMDKQLKLTYPRHTYEHEVLAVFGTSEKGVFLPNQIAAALKDYPLGQQLLPGEVAGIGVDCNDPANGTHAVVMALNNVTQQARMIDKAILRGEAFSKSKSEQMLIDLFVKWKPILLAFDKGHAHGQIDDLSEWAIHHPQSGMSDALKFYDLGKNYVFHDPVTNLEMSRPMKPLMVGIGQSFLTEKHLTLPKCEDIESGVVGQMRGFHIKRQGADGRPIYKDEGEHTLVAMLICLLSWRLEILGFEPMASSTAILRRTKSQVPDSLPNPIGMRTNTDDGQGLLAQTVQTRRVSAPARTQLGDNTRRSLGRVSRKHF